MEQDQRNKKRAREDDDGENEIGSSFENNNSNAKKRDVNGMSFMKKKEEEEVEENGFFKGWDSSHFALGVFDFPWLKDGGVMSNSDDWFLDFEDNFLQSHTSSRNDHGGVDIFEECGLCNIPEASTSHVQDAKFLEDDVGQQFEGNGLELEAEDVDCIWSSLLNKPI